MLKRRVVLQAAAAAVFPLLQPRRAVAAEALLIGTHLDLSGPATIVMPAIRNALQMRIDEANEAGGVRGRPVKLIVEDNAGQPSQAVRAASRLIDKDGVMAMLCPWGSGTNLATVRRTVESGVLCFAPYAAAGPLRQAAAGNPLLFTLNPDYDRSTAAAVSCAISLLKAQRFGLVYHDNPYGEAVRRGVQAGLAQRGGTLATEIAYKPGEIDFAARVARLRAARVDLIVCAASARETIAICTEVKRAQWDDVRVMTASPVRNTQVTQLGQDSVEGLYGIGTWLIEPPERMTPPARAWAASYRRRFGIEADDVAMVFYDQADWFMTALAAAGADPTAARVGKALATSSYRGSASYDTQHFVDNHVAPEWIRIERVERGRWVPQSDVIDPARPGG